MSVHSNDNAGSGSVMGDALRDALNQKQQQTAAPQAAAHTEIPTKEAPKMSQTQNAAPSITPNAFNLNRVLSRPMTRAPLGEQLAKYIESLKEVAKVGVEDEGFQRALSFDVLTDTAVPAILVSLVMNVDGNTHVGVFELVVERGVEGTIADRAINDGFGQFQLRRTTADAADKGMWAAAEAAIRNRVGGTPSIHFAGSLVLPKDLDEKSPYMRQVMYYAIAAIYTVLEEETGGAQVAFSLDNLTAGVNLNVSLDYAPGEVLTVTGQPLRSDLHVSLRATEAVNQAADSLVQRRQADLTHVDGFIDLVWNPPSAPTYYGQPPKTQQWNPRFVMTRVDTDLDSITLPAQLLALGSAFAVGANWAFAGVWLPRYASHAMRSGNRGAAKDVELRDLGALGLEIDLLGKGLARHSVLTSKTSDDDLRMLVATAINPEMVFTMKIEEVGQLAWIQGVFAASAAGSAKATRDIINAANELTKGEFGKRWADTNEAIVYDDKVREHTGYYTARSDGQRHDIAEIDLLAALNIMGEKDMDLVRRFQATYDAVDVSVLRRQADRLAILEQVLGAGNITLTGNANRYTFGNTFLRTLADSITAAGADIRPSNVQQLDFSGAAGRQQYNLAHVALAPSQVAGLFSGNRPTGNYNGSVSTAYGRSY